MDNSEGVRLVADYPFGQNGLSDFRGRERVGGKCDCVDPLRGEQSRLQVGTNYFCSIEQQPDYLVQQRIPVRGAVCFRQCDHLAVRSPGILRLTGMVSCDWG